MFYVDGGEWKQIGHRMQTALQGKRTGSPYQPRGGSTSRGRSVREDSAARAEGPGDARRWPSILGSRWDTAEGHWEANWSEIHTLSDCSFIQQHSVVCGEVGHVGGYMGHGPCAGQISRNCEPARWSWQERKVGQEKMERLYRGLTGEALLCRDFAFWLRQRVEWKFAKEGDEVWNMEVCVWRDGFQNSQFCWLVGSCFPKSRENLVFKIPKFSNFDKIYIIWVETSPASFSC